jgi:glycosyltransferase involved in cell wall biosynthesis
MHVACVSYFFEERLRTPDALLAAYPTLSGWAEGVAAAGARVSVVQRFCRDAQLVRGNVEYRFVADRSPWSGRLLDPARRVNQAVASLAPSVVHVNGLMSAWPACLLKRRLPGTPLMIQDHANLPPAGGLRAAALRFALRSADAVSFAAPEQAQPWRNGGFLRADTPAFALMEGSTRFQLAARTAARPKTGLTGAPLCLWVGRLDANKDPLTALEGFALAAPGLPGARLAMVFHEAQLLSEVRAWVAAHPDVRGRVTLLGRLPHGEMEAVYNSADLFVLGSHHEGSGYAAIEAMACGVVPVLTDIPSFRALLGRGKVGALWPVGDAAALADALNATTARLCEATPRRVRDYFEAHWSFEAIGREAVSAYRELLDRKRR